MKRAAVAATVGALALALWSSALAAPAAKRLEEFLPPRLDGAELALSPAAERTVGQYQLTGKAGDARHVAVTLIAAPDAIEVRDATIVLKPGKTLDFAGYSYEGLRQDGRFVQRACALDGVECQVDVMLAKRLLVSLRVERPADRAEALRLLAQVDLKGLEAFARKQPVARASRSGDAGADRLQKEQAKLVDIWRAEQRAWLKAAGTPGSVAPSAKTWTAPAAAAESLTAEQIQRGLGARSLGVRACYEVAAEENPQLSGGDITVSFTVEPTGKMVNPKVEATTVADQAVEACVLRQLRKTSFPAARESTSARHTFAFSAASSLMRSQ